ncbi:MAG: precorrin-8X methylmutase [Symbiobacteriia bacterium]
MRQTLVERYGMHPADIEVRSFQIIDELVPENLLPPDDGGKALAKRMIHASGDPNIAGHIRVSPGAVEAGIAALRRGCAIYTDVRMVSVGINAGMAGILGNTTTCLMDDPRVPERARSDGTTRAVAAVRLYAEQLSGSIMVIGNAPTALLALLDLMDEGRCRPALVIGTPVGFVNAAESKEELLKRDVPCATLLGSRGGSAMAAAAVNALLKIATGQARPGDHYRNR